MTLWRPSDVLFTRVWEKNETELVSERVLLPRLSVLETSRVAKES